MPSRNITTITINEGCRQSWVTYITVPAALRRWYLDDFLLNSRNCCAAYPGLVLCCIASTSRCAVPFLSLLPLFPIYVSLGVLDFPLNRKRQLLICIASSFMSHGCQLHFPMYGEDLELRSDICIVCLGGHGVGKRRIRFLVTLATLNVKGQGAVS